MIRVPFVHLFQTESCKYAYDVNSNDIVKMSDAAFDILTLLLSGIPESEVRKELQRDYSEEEISSTCDQLESLQAEGRLFSDKKPKELLYLPCEHVWENMYDLFIEQITLEVTQRCNMRCRYCSYTDIYPENRGYNNLDMPWETAKTAMDYLLAHGGREANPLKNRPQASRDFSLAFYGGEPLLRVDFVVDCVRYIKERLSQDRECHFSLTTNATLLDSSTVKCLMDNGVSITISLDGPREIHDKARVFPDGRGTYDKVLEAIENMQSYASTLKPDTPISSMINCVTAGGFDWVELWDYFTSLENLLYTPYMQFVINKNSMEGGLSAWNNAYPDDQLSEATGFRQVWDEYEKACLAGVYRNETGTVSWRMLVLDYLVRQNYFFEVHGRTRNQYEGQFELPDAYHPGGICLVGKRRPYVMVDGTILPCERVPTNNKYFCMGKIEDGISWKKGKELVDDFTKMSEEDCKSCWCLRMCGIGCTRDMIVGGSPSAEKKIAACYRLRECRHHDLIHMTTLLEKDPAVLDHFDKVLVS
ncbi:MAG: radical SAM protein [bacterium]